MEKSYLFMLTVPRGAFCKTRIFPGIQIVQMAQQRSLQRYFTWASSQAATLGTDFNDRSFSSGKIFFACVDLLALLCLEYRLQFVFLMLELRNLRNLAGFSDFGLVWLFCL